VSSPSRVVPGKKALPVENMLDGRILSGAIDVEGWNGRELVRGGRW
jgi:hypothetical protein